MDSVKNYAVHMAVSFAAAFFAALAMLLNAGAITPTNLGWSVIASVAFSAFSSALKGITEGLVLPAGRSLVAAFSPTLEK